MQQFAGLKRESWQSLGIFLFFATRQGDSWMLDGAAGDALQLAEEGKPIDINIVETEAGLEITWSHRFVIRDKLFVTSTYPDGAETPHPDYPTRRIEMRLAKALAKFSPEQLMSMHVQPVPVEPHA
jgi:hypothetical protein